MNPKKLSFKTCSLGIIGIGLDLVEVARIRKALQKNGDKFIEKVFVPGETRYCQSLKNPWPSFAGRWAAKEAVMKAFGPECKKIWWPCHIEITRGAAGQPGVILHGPARQAARKMKVSRVLVSITHTAGMAAANALLIGG